MISPIKTTLLANGLVAFGRTEGVGTLVLRRIEARLIADFVASAEPGDTVTLKRDRPVDEIRLLCRKDSGVRIESTYFREFCDADARSTLKDLLIEASLGLSSYAAASDEDKRALRNRRLERRALTYDIARGGVNL